MKAKHKSLVLTEPGRADRTHRSHPIPSRRSVAVWAAATILAHGSAFAGVVTYRTVAVVGDPAPGTEPGVAFASSCLYESNSNDGNRPPILNDLGQTAFIACLSGPGVDETNDTGIWSEGSGSLTLIAREGAPAPGIEADAIFLDLTLDLTRVVLNNAGQTTFLAKVSGLGTSIWTDGPGGLTLLVAGEGAQAAGTEEGVTYGQFERVQFNDEGQVVFRTVLSGPGVDQTNDVAIFSNVSGTMSLVVREGGPAPQVGPDMVFDFGSSAESVGSR